MAMVAQTQGSSQLDSCFGVTKSSDTFVYKKCKQLLLSTPLSSQESSVLPLSFIGSYHRQEQMFFREPEAVSREVKMLRKNKQMNFLSSHL